MKKIRFLIKKVIIGIKKLWNKGKLGKAIVIIGALFIIGFIIPNETKEDTLKNESAQVVDKAEEQENEIVKTPEEEFKDILKEEYGENYTINIDPATNQITITTDIKDNLSVKLIKVGFKSDMYNTLKQTQNNEYLNQFNSITFIGETIFVDKYGQESEGKGFIYTFDMEEIKKINFENIYYEDLSELAKIKYNNPTLDE